MKRDMDLVRKIVFAIEDRASGFALAELKIEGYTQEQIGYHVCIMIEAGLLEGDDATTWGDKSPQADATRLTWDGHDFADAARDDSRWNRAMEIVKKKAGSITISVLKELLVSLMKQSLGLG
jgi:hypothetical protein